MTRIAISYRRTNSAAITGRIFDRLTLRYGEDAVFMDIDNIPVGTDFRRHIEKVLADSDILVAVIGTRWRGTDRIRIMEKSDPVRVEIEMSQQFGLAVVPVLVDGARMPSADELPESLTDFAYINAAVVDSGVDFRQHIERLCRSLDRIIAQRAEDAHAAAAFTFPLPDASPLPEDAPTPETATPDASAVQEMPTPPDVSAWRDAAPWVEEPAVNDQPDIEQQPHETEYTHDDGPERRTRILRWAVRLGGVVALALLLIFTMPDFFAGSDPGPSPVIQADTQPTKVAPPPPLPVRRNKTLSEHIVQIAIVNSEELAQTSYRDLRTRYPRLLADRSAYILEDPWRISSQLPAFQILIGSFELRGIPRSHSAENIRRPAARNAGWKASLRPVRRKCPRSIARVPALLGGFPCSFLILALRRLSRKRIARSGFAIRCLPSIPRSSGLVSDPSAPPASTGGGRIQMILFGLALSLHRKQQQRSALNSRWQQPIGAPRRMFLHLPHPARLLHRKIRRLPKQPRCPCASPRFRLGLLSICPTAGQKRMNRRLRPRTES